MSVPQIDPVERAAQALLADHLRLETSLPAARVARVAFRRELSPDDQVRLHARLRELGVGIEFESAPSDNRSSEAFAIDTAELDPLQPISTRRLCHRILSRTEEREFARVVRLAEETRDRCAGPPEVRAAILDRGAKAKETLILHNLRLVQSIAKTYVGRSSFDEQDLFQEGVLGLMRAIDSFDPELGTKLSTYATFWIRQSIERAMCDKGELIRLPAYRTDECHRYERLQRFHRRASGRSASLGSAATELGWTLEKTAFIRNLCARRLLPLDGPVAPGTEEMTGAFLESSFPNPEESCMVNDLNHRLFQLVGTLPSRHRQVVLERFGLGTPDGSPRTLEEVGKEFGVTRERVRQIEKKSLGRLRARVGSRRDEWL